MLVRDKYRIVQELGRGQFGRVYQALTLPRGPQVAVKFDVSTTRVLKHEVTILNYLHLRGCQGRVPKIIWYGLAAWAEGAVPHPCLVLPYYDRSLRQVLETAGLDPVQRTAWMEDILATMGEVHDRLVIHRDIKPDNFMIRGDRIYLIDFGLATFYVDGNTGQHLPPHDPPKTEMLGSPVYTSIHIHQGCRAARRDDMIQLGYVFLAMYWEGRLPWQGIVTPSTSYTLQDIRHPLNQERYRHKIRVTENPRFPPELRDYFYRMYRLGYLEEPSYIL